MNLTNEREEIKELLLSGGGYGWKGIDGSRETYFMKYEEGIHTSSILEEYDSENMPEMGRKLKLIWKEGEFLKMIPFIITSLKKCDGEEEGRFKNIELNNYMM